jgi:hypothetical protein
MDVLVGVIVALVVFFYIVDAVKTQVRQIRAVPILVHRIEAKALRLKREARTTGAPYSELATKAPELAEQARQLAARIRQIQDVAKAMARESRAPTPTSPPAASGADGEMLRREYAAIEATRQRTSSLLERNERQRQLCLLRLQRICELLDAAWVEMSQPIGPLSEARAGSEILQEVEMELQAARDALAEVERSEQQQA